MEKLRCVRSLATAQRDSTLDEQPIMMQRINQSQMNENYILRTMREETLTSGCDQKKEETSQNEGAYTHTPERYVKPSNLAKTTHI